MAKILIVEDDALLSDAYKLTLGREGHTVLVARDGKQALGEVKKNEPDIILLDILMPVMSGLEFLEAYDLPHKHPSVKVVIMSNLGQDSEVQKALRLGAYKYLIKAHTSPQDLCVLVNHLIKKNLSPGRTQTIA